MIGLKFILEVKQKFSILMDESSMKKYILMLFLSFISAVLELVGVSLLLYTILAIFEEELAICDVVNSIENREIRKKD